MQSYKPRMVAEWVDITLAAVERKVINKDPKAFFHYYIQRAAKRQTTPPDWWLELRKREERKRFEEQRVSFPNVTDAMNSDQTFEEAFDNFIETEGKDAVAKITGDLFDQFTKAGQTRPEAEPSAETFARQHLKNRFLSDHPEFHQSA